MSTIAADSSVGAGGAGAADDSVDLYQHSVEFYRLLRTSSTLCLLNVIGGVARDANFTAVSSGQIQVWSGLLPSSLSDTSSTSRRPQNVPVQAIPASLFFKNLAQPFVTPRSNVEGDTDGGSSVLSFHSAKPLLDLNGTSPPPSSMSQNRPNHNSYTKGNNNDTRVSIAASHVEIVMALSNLLL